MVGLPPKLWMRERSRYGARVAILGVPLAVGIFLMKIIIYLELYSREVDGFNLEY